MRRVSGLFGGRAYFPVKMNKIGKKIKHFDLYLSERVRKKE
jgi:hypothetical protein